MLISVVIPVYNSEKTIKVCIDSILNQTYTGAIEIIIINDGSKDNSQKIIEQIIESNVGPMTIQLTNKINAGVSRARNTGMKLAKGDWIAFLDSDDEWASNKIERQMKFITENQDISFIGCNRNNEHFLRFFWIKFSHLTRITARMLLYKNFFATPTVMIKKNVMDNVGLFSENQDYCEDANYWIRIASAGFKCFLLNESLVTTGDGKPHFGHVGLSSNLGEMAIGDLQNMRLGYQLKVVKLLEFVFLFCYSRVKYIRRLLIVKLGR
ncbi:glycosyltransferase family A protein [Pedobacter miscanthi]|uniref:glycosyltransferase family 2 protein n=1 Tax=Pedobacter miscanthi TaxID=2259170 RepID=UPI00292D1EF5|nr:glycosyltransferase family A protein [Pedobacter miscanthi]